MLNKTCGNNCEGYQGCELHCSQVSDELSRREKFWFWCSETKLGRLLWRITFIIRLWKKCGECYAVPMGICSMRKSHWGKFCLKNDYPNCI